MAAWGAPELPTYIKCFGPDQMSVAYAYLGLDDHERQRVALTLERLEKHVD